MNRKMFSLAGVLVAALSLTVGSSDAEARCCRVQRNRCCQQNGNVGHHNSGFRNSGNCGIQQNCNTGCGNNGYQQTSNYGPGQMTYGTSGTATVNQPTPPVEAPPVPATAPAPAN